MGQYMKDLQFKKDNFNRYVASPYDAWLNKNQLPRQPLSGETPLAYSKRLLADVNGLSSPVWVTAADGTFAYHANPFQFGPTELAGLKIFLSAAPAGSGDDQHAGNCVACHTAPTFSDFVFHNTGVNQDEYDGVHGDGAFIALHIPGLAEREAIADIWSSSTPSTYTDRNSIPAPPPPPTPPTPTSASGTSTSIRTFPFPENIAGFVCAAGTAGAAKTDCSVDQGLASTIAQFKTPLLRDVVDSATYFHNGSRNRLEVVIALYIRNSALARTGNLRNAPAEFSQMSLSTDDISSLTAFLLSLTEDYDDA